MLSAAWFMSQPGCRRNKTSKKQVFPDKLRQHVEMLSDTLYPRDWRHTANLDKCAEYIAGHFGDAGADVEFQPFTVDGNEYRNVIGRFGTGQSRKLIIGAHYDAYAGSPGADDNASGVAVLIELARLLGQHPPDIEVELVGFVLEEPPFFRTPQMGSAVHARSIAHERARIIGMLSLEMVGYFSDKRWSQQYPLPFLYLFYPSRANFIGVVGRWDQGRWVRKIKAGMQGATSLPVRSIRAPSFIPGVDFSDHMNYWPHGIDALMITDTAFYRNPHYHTIHDTPDTLDYARMADVVVALFETVKTFDR